MFTIRIPVESDLTEDFDGCSDIDMKNYQVETAQIFEDNPLINEQLENQKIKQLLRLDIADDMYTSD